MRKVRSWELWDWTSIRNFIFILIAASGIFILFSRLPDWLHNSNDKLLTRETSGKFVSAEYLTQPSMGKTGNHLIVTAVAIEYTYIVNGKIYYCTDKIPNSVEHQLFFGNLKANPAMTLKIKYNPTNPQQSQIQTSKE